VRVALRDAAGEVDAGQVLGGGDGVPEHGAVCGDELDDVGREAAVAQDPVDGVASRHGRVAGLPQNYVTLGKHTLCQQKHTTNSTVDLQLEDVKVSSYFQCTTRLCIMCTANVY